MEKAVQGVSFDISLDFSRQMGYNRQNAPFGGIC